MSDNLLTASIKVSKEKGTKRNLVTSAMATTFFMLMMAITNCEAGTFHKAMIATTVFFFIITVLIYWRTRDVELEFEMVIHEDKSTIEIVRYENLNIVVTEAEVFPMILRKLVISGFDERGEEINVQIPNTREIRNFFKKNGFEVK